jgi:hypothetical protein
VDHSETTMGLLSAEMSPCNSTHGGGAAGRLLNRTGSGVGAQRGQPAAAQQQQQQQPGRSQVGLGAHPCAAAVTATAACLHQACHAATHAAVLLRAACTPPPLVPLPPPPPRRLRPPTACPAQPRA